MFRLSHRILAAAEGPNDGVVSVASSKWGGEKSYKGTLAGVSHLDLINWSNRLEWLAREIIGNRRKSVTGRSIILDGWWLIDCRFNAIVLYLDIAGKHQPSAIVQHKYLNLMDN